MTDTKLLLVRHAHADWEPDEMRPLSAKGLEDAQRVAAIVASLDLRAIYSSPYRRARQTVEPLARHTGIEIEEMVDLRERSLGSGWEPDWEATIRPTWEDFSFAYPDGGETNAQAMERARRVLDTLRERHSGETVVVATHGNLLVLMLRLLDPTLGFEFWRSLSLPDIYRFDLATRGAFEIERMWTEPDPS